MVPAALWAALGVGLQLWAIVPSQFVLPTYALEPGNESKGQPRQYYDKRAGTNCTMCPPGYFVENFCTKTTDTVCSLCKDSTYTQIYNWISTCFSCSAQCSSDQIEVRPCTPKQNRVCTCRSGWYCMLTRQEGCRVCAMLRRCPPGFGVAKPGTATSNVLCAPCTPGTFSDTTSSTDMCRPHRNCSSVAVPGNASVDAVCESPTPSLGVSGNTSTDTACESSPPVLTLGSAPYNITLPVGLIVGVTALAVVIIVLVNCVIVTKRKKKPLCLQGESKVPNLPADKARGVPGPEQQYLLTTAPSSSSSSLESSASAANKRAPPGNQPQAPGREKAGGARETWASCESSEPYPSGHGTQVNVTCVVNVCSSSQHGPQCPSQASSTMGDMDASHSGSPRDEQLPFSKEERPFQSHLGSPEMLQKSSEEKSLPLGVPDAGMKLL